MRKVRAKSPQKEIHMNRTYEVMYIVRPDLEEADLEKLVEGFNTVVTNGGGEVTNIERLGRRRLAYIVRKFQDGIYVLLHISADGPLVAELERRLRVTEQVIKFITVRTDEENKRLAKVKAHRDSKVKLSAQHAPAQAAPAAPAEVPAEPVAEASVAEAAAEPETAAV
jgi:small subunit ribosomal protein S6